MAIKHWKANQRYCEAAGASIVILRVPFLAGHEEIVASVAAQLASVGRVRFAFLDHISSQPALLLPTATWSRVLDLSRTYAVGIQ